MKKILCLMLCLMILPCWAFGDGTTHTVSFNTGGLVSIAQQRVDHGSYASRPTEISYDDTVDATKGLHLQNWYTEAPSASSTYTDLCYTPDSNGKIFDFSKTQILHDTVIYAGYWGILSYGVYDVTNSQTTKGGQVRHVSPYNPNAGYVNYTGGTTVIAGTKVTSYAKPADGYHFVGWSTSTSENDIVNKNAEYSFIFTQRITLYALFAEGEAPAEPEPAPADPAENVCLSKPKSVKLTAVSAKKIKVSWKKLSSKDKKKIKKIQIQVSLDKSFSKLVKEKIVSSGKTSWTIPGLKKNTKYFVRIRAYAKSGNELKVSKWVVKSKKTKKK